MGTKKNDMLGAGVAGILGGAPVQERQPAKKTDDGYFAYHRGRPRKESQQTAIRDKEKTYASTTIWLEQEQYRRVREMAQDQRKTIREMMNILIEAGLKAVSKENSRKA